MPVLAHSLSMPRVGMGFSSARSLAPRRRTAVWTWPLVQLVACLAILPASVAAQSAAPTPDGLRLGALYSAADRANPRISAANALVTAAEARARATDLRWDVRSQVAAAFYEVYRTERAITIAGNTRRLMQDVAATTEAMYRVGETAQADVLKAQVEIARMSEDIIAMRAMRAVNLARLGGLLNQAMDSSTAAAVLPAFPDRLPPPDSLIAQAAAGRPMVRAGEADLHAAEAEARLAQREIWPDLQLGVQYGQRGGMTGVERMGSLMVGASVPIFVRSRQYKMREETEAMRAMAAADLAAMRADTRAKVGTAYAEIG